MEMKQEKAIKRLKTLKARCERLVVSSNRGPEEWRKDAEAVDFAISALRPVSREQVEKVWPGCPYCKEDGEGYVQKFGAYSIQNGELTTGHCKPQKIKFCPHCSRPLTDEAVEMVMERLEELHSETKTD